MSWSTVASLARLASPQRATLDIFGCKGNMLFSKMQIFFRIALKHFMHNLKRDCNQLFIKYLI